MSEMRTQFRPRIFLTKRVMSRAGFISTALAALLSGCGTVVKNPSQPKPQPTGMIDVASLVIGQWLDDFHDGLRAPAASLSPPSGVAGTTLNCAAQDDGSLSIQFAAPVALSVREELEGGAVFQLDRSGTQTHTHRWSATGSSAMPNCTGEGHIDRSWLQVQGLGLNYDFTVDMTGTVNADAGKREPATFGVRASGTRSLDFTDGDAPESMRLNWTSNVVRTVTSRGATLGAVALDATEQRVDYRIDSDGNWTEVLVQDGSWRVALRDQNGTELANGVISATGVRMDRRGTNGGDGASARASCLPRAGEVSVEWNGLAAGNPGELSTGRATTARFGGSGLPVVSEGGGGQGGKSAQIAPLWCLE